MEARFFFCGCLFDGFLGFFLGWRVGGGSGRGFGVFAPNLNVLA